MIRKLLLLTLLTSLLACSKKEIKNDLAGDAPIVKQEYQSITPNGTENLDLTIEGRYFTKDEAKNEIFPYHTLGPGKVPLMHPNNRGGWEVACSDDLNEKKKCVRNRQVGIIFDTGDLDLPDQEDPSIYNIRVRDARIKLGIYSIRRPGLWTDLRSKTALICILGPRPRCSGKPMRPRWIHWNGRMWKNKTDEQRILKNSFFYDYIVREEDPNSNQIEIPQAELSLRNLFGFSEEELKELLYDNKSIHISIADDYYVEEPEIVVDFELNGN